MMKTLQLYTLYTNKMKFTAKKYYLICMQMCLNWHNTVKDYFFTDSQAKRYFQSFYDLKSYSMIILILCAILLNEFDHTIYAATPDLESFKLRGHNLRLVILRDEVEELNACNDIEAMKDILTDLHNIILTQSSSAIQTDPFSSSSEEVNLIPSQAPFFFKMFIKQIMLFVILSLLGLIFIKYFAFVIPIKDQIMDLLEIIEMDMTIYYEPFSDYYESLIEDVFMDDESLFNN